MCVFCNVWVFVCVGYLMCVYVWIYNVWVCMCGFCNVWVCVCVGFVICVVVGFIMCGWVYVSVGLLRVGV